MGFNGLFNPDFFGDLVNFYGDLMRFNGLFNPDFYGDLVIFMVI